MSKEGLKQVWKCLKSVIVVLFSLCLLCAVWLASDDVRSLSVQLKNWWCWLPLFARGVAVAFLILFVLLRLVHWLGPIWVPLWNLVCWLRGVIFNESSDQAAERKDYFKEVEDRYRNMVETYSNALGFAVQPGRKARCREREEYLQERFRRDFKTLKKAIYYGLAGDKPLYLQDWTGNPQKQALEVEVVGVTRDRVIVWKGTQQDEDDGKLHPNITEYSLKGMVLRGEWHHGDPWRKFWLWFINAGTGQPVGVPLKTERWNCHEPALRLAVTNARRPHFSITALVRSVVDSYIPKPPTSGPPES